MYIAYKDDNIIAYHPDLDVVETYVENIYKTHGEDLKIGKLRKKLRFKLNGKEDLILVRYGNTYVQEGYLAHYQIMTEQMIEDHKYARDVIYRILEMNEVSKKDRKTLEKSVKILSDMVDEDSIYTPTLSELKILKEDHERYLYTMSN